MLRPSGTRLPLDPFTHTQSALPLGVLIAPLSPSPQPRPTTLSESQYSQHLAACASAAHDLPRCVTCASYISARCNMNARYWRCALCSARNDLPNRYAPTVSAGEEAVDIVPEISRDIYDVPVVEGAVDVGMSPTAYIFVIDEGGDQAYLDTARMAVKAALDVIQGESLVGVMLYGRYLKLLDLRGEELFRRVCPLDEGLCVPHVFAPDQWLRLSTERKVLDVIVDALARVTPVLYDAGNPPRRALGAAVKTVLDMVEVAGLVATRVVVIGAGGPNFGIGSVDLVGDDTGHASDRFPVPALPFYADQGLRASLLGSMVDMYIVSGEPIDVASIAPLAQTSGGRLTLYETSKSALSQDVWQHLNDPAVVRGLLRVRCSPEITVKDVYRCGVYRDSEVPEVCRVSCHGHKSTLAADLEFTEKDGFTKDESKVPCIQIAFRGIFVEPGILPQRVLRVETQTYPTSSSKETIRKEADANAMATLMFHKALATADERGIGEARMQLFDWLADLLAKTGVRAEEAKGEIMIDGSLREYPSLRKIPQLIFGLIRSPLFRQEAVSEEVRAATRCMWEDLSPELLASAVYPRLYSFLNLEEKSIKELPLSTIAVKECGHAVFLLDAFSKVVVYYTATRGKELVFPPPESSTVMRARAACMSDRPVTPECIICREGTAKDRWFKNLLIEDAVPGAAAQSFSAFMQGVVDSAIGLAEELTQ